MACVVGLQFGMCQSGRTAQPSNAQYLNPCSCILVDKLSVTCNLDSDSIWTTLCGNITSHGVWLKQGKVSQPGLDHTFRVSDLCV